VIAQQKGLIAVARQEANIICVGALGGAFQDVVFLLDVMTSPIIKVVEIANDFEIFILLACNLCAIADEYEDDPGLGVEKMELCCVHFKCSDTEKLFWKSRALEMLS
jgi:hypothetical protein